MRSWAARKDNIVDDDLVLFIQFGLNHIPRIEDFPVRSPLPTQGSCVLTCRSLGDARRDNQSRYEAGQFLRSKPSS